MSPSFQGLFDEIELQRRQVLDSVGELTETQLNKAPQPGKWSIAEILSHVISAERLSVLYVQKKMLGVAEAADSGMWEEVKMGLLKISQRVPGIKFKAPQRLLESTMVYKNLSDIRLEWDRVRNEFKLLLEKIPEQYVRRKIYRHVRAGYLNPKHAILFFREHLIHHQPQIRRLLK